jgi:formate dehydrogenase maturation protein FdhE
VAQAQFSKKKRIFVLDFLSGAWFVVKSEYSFSMEDLMVGNQATLEVVASEFATTSYSEHTHDSAALVCPVCGGATVYHGANPPSPAYYWCEHCQAGWDASRLGLAAAC